MIQPILLQLTRFLPGKLSFLYMIRKKKISINDIARKFNTSKSTVSFILNGKAKEKRISEELTKNVLEHIDAIGFRRDSVALSLATGKTKTIGLIVENIGDPFFASVASLIEEKAYENKYKISYSSTNGNTAKAISLINMFNDRRVDGYIICPPEHVNKQVKALIEEGTPTILFDRFIPELQADYIGIDNMEITYKAVKHLYESGYRNIALVTLDSSQTQMQARLEGYRKYIFKKGLKEYLLKIPFNLSEQQAITRITSFLKRNKKIDAILFATNYLAVRGLQSIRKLSLSIPDQVGVVAFDDNSLFKLYSPSITAIAQPIEALSERLIDMLLERMQESTAGGRKKKVIVPAKLVIRDSTRKPVAH